VEDYYALLELGTCPCGYCSKANRVFGLNGHWIGEENAPCTCTLWQINGWLDGQIAISVNEYGKGRVYYVGAYLDDASQQAFLHRFLEMLK
jgi:hypothetical protein